MINRKSSDSIVKKETEIYVLDNIIVLISSSIVITGFIIVTS